MDFRLVSRTKIVTEKNRGGSEKNTVFSTKLVVFFGSSEWCLLSCFSFSRVVPFRVHQPPRHHFHATSRSRTLPTLASSLLDLPVTAAATAEVALPELNLGSRGVN